MGTSLLGNLSDLQAQQLGLQGLFESLCSAAGALDGGNMLLEQTFTVGKPNKAGSALDVDDTNATDPTAEQIVCAYLPRRAKIVSVYYTPSTSTNLTAGATTQNATVAVFARPGLTGVTSQSTLMTATTTVTTSGGTGNWTQWTPVNLAINVFDPTNTFVPAGGCITYSITKGAVGVVVPGGKLSVRVQYV